VDLYTLIGLAVLVLGAAIGYRMASPAAYAWVVPFVIWGLTSLDEGGPLENTDSGWGIVVLIGTALPALVGVTAGLITRAAVARRRARLHP
jgi:hypothetical protein